jgi:DNA primase
MNNRIQALAEKFFTARSEKDFGNLYNALYKGICETANKVLKDEEAAKEGKLIFSEKDPNTSEKEKIMDKYTLGDELMGEVTGVVDFGIFVKIEDGLEGLVHISEIDWGLVDDPHKFAKVGDKVKVKVIEVKDGKISLSIKALKENPWSEAKKKYKKDDAVVVEGQMDCIKAHQAGFLNTVATSGTALTAEQLRLLSRLTKNLKLCFDADVAGQRAAKKAGELALSMGFSVKVITVVGAKDPDELISQDPKLWEEALQSSVWFVEHFLIQAEKGFPARSVEQRKFITHEVAPLLRLVTDALERDHYVQSITERFGFSQQAVLDMLRTGNQPASPLGGLSPEVSVVPDELPVPLIEKQMLGVLLAEPTLRQEWLDLGGRVEDFTDLRARELVALALTSGNSAVTSQSLAQEALFMVESEKTREDGNEAVFLSELQKITYSFRLAALKARQQQVTANIRTADGQKNVQALHELQREFAGLSVARLDLEKKIQSI